MTTYKPGDCVLIPFPFTDLSSVKQRPGVILSSERFNAKGVDLIVAAVTSQIPPTIDEDDILLNGTEIISAGLPKISLVKTGKIVTIDQRLIRRRLGTLTPNTLQVIREAIRRIIS